MLWNSRYFFALHDLIDSPAYLLYTEKNVSTPGGVKMDTIVRELFAMQDCRYRDFHAKLIPNISPDKIIGVRTPELRKYARELAKRPEAKAFLEELPHTYYEENNLHGFLLSILYKDIDVLLEKTEQFLPYVDNWATCDLMSPKLFKKHLPLVFTHIQNWLKSEHVYEVRFALVTLLGFYLDDAFESEMLQMAADVHSEEYYIRMAVAWYFSMALVKQYDVAVKYFETPCMDIWTHNKAIQKALESYRISAERKEYLRSLKLKKQ